MGKRKSKLQRRIEDLLIQDAISRAQRPTLANPAFGTHALVQFAADNRERFRTWVNADAGIVPGDEPKTAEEIDQFLEMIHEVIHAAMVASLIELPNGAKVHFVESPRHTRPTRPTE